MTEFNPRPTECPYCNSPVLLENSTVIYNRDYGSVYICSRYPECNAYVGVHRGTKNAKGTLANPALRELRKSVHALFDPIWMSGTMKRHKAYRLLSDLTGVPFKDCHIGQFDSHRCLEAIKVLTEYKQAQ